MFGRRRWSPAPSPRTRPEFVGITPTAQLYEFTTDSGEHLDLNEFRCTDIRFRPRERRLLVAFEAWFGVDDDPIMTPVPKGAILTLTFDDVQVMTWVDTVEEAERIRADRSDDWRGEVDDFRLVDPYTFMLTLMDLEITFTASRLTYDLR